MSNALQPTPRPDSMAGLDVARRAIGPERLDAMRQAAVEGLMDSDKAREVAAGFESMFLHQLVKAMRGTVDEEGLLGDGTTRQMNDIFWFHMTDAIAAEGGMGIGRTIYQDIMRQHGLSPIESGDDGPADQENALDASR